MRTPIRTRALLAATAGLIAAALPAAPAQAAPVQCTVVASLCPASTASLQSGRLLVEEAATSSVSNNITVTFSSVSASPVTVVKRTSVLDTAGVQAGAGCEPVTPTEVTCLGWPGSSVSVELLGGDDFVRFASTAFGLPPTSLFGGGGNDDLRGLANVNNTIAGEAGNDFLAGKTWDDVLAGGSGSDSITASSGADEVWGEGGSDWLHGDGGDDFVDAGSEDDVIHGGDGWDEVRAGAGIDTAYGGAGGDDLSGDGGGDSLWGEAGDDLLSGQYRGDPDTEVDYINCGEGWDQYWWRNDIEDNSCDYRIP